MNNKNKSNGIGAKVLGADELIKILPTYDRLLEQIEAMKLNAYEEMKKIDKNSKNSIQQTVNNIGILGVRGSGKTSIINTLSNKFADENDIVLPLIVPDDMPEAITLMGTILGHLKVEMDKIDVKEDQKCESWARKQTKLEVAYTKLIKEFCSIQDEYQSVVLNQYSTAENYNRNHSEIYGDSINFKKTFANFINLLVQTKQEQSDDKESIILVFIDDIDLSTSRCTDVIKTLLTHLSHPLVVTIISGDITTFEEALTLDFMKNDNLLNSNIINEKVVENKTVLESKKELAYEYLKKILPPVYRHSVKKWTIYDRGEYYLGDNSRQDISWLLNEILKRKNSFTNTDELIPQMFHIFDETSRGLNNVYNILSELNEVTVGEEDERFILVKALLETIVSANKKLNDKKEMIFNKLIIFGDNAQNTKIDFENLSDLLKIDEFFYKTNDTDTVMSFTMFLYMEFATKLLNKDLNDNDVYKTLKSKILLMLFMSPKVSNRISNDVTIDDSTYELLFTEYTEKSEVKHDFLLKLIWFYIKLDFKDAIIFFNKVFANRYDEIAKALSEKQENYDIDTTIIGDIYSAFSDISFNRYMLNKGISNILKDYIKRDTLLTKSLTKDIVDICNKDRLKVADVVFTNSRKKEVDSLLARNTIHHMIETNIIDGDNVKNIIEVKSELDTEVKSRLNFINTINEKNLWGIEESELVKIFLEKAVKATTKKIHDSEGTVEIENLDKCIEKIENIYKGVSDTLAKKLLRALKGLVNLSNVVTYKEACNRAEYLAFSSSAKYGVSEAYFTHLELQKARYKFEFEQDEIAYMHGYMLSQKIIKNVDKDTLSKNEKFIKEIGESFRKHNDECIQSIENELFNSNGIDEAMFGKLFSCDTTKNKEN